MSIKRTPIKKRRSKPRRELDPQYLDFIVQQLCCVCTAMSLKQSTRTEAAHVGERGLGQKCSDRKTLPVCERHHRTGPLAQHKIGKKFWTHFGLDKEQLIADYQARYESERSKS